MDHNSMNVMRGLRDKHLVASSTPLWVLDVGAMDVQGTYGNYRKWFPVPDYYYVGLDIEPGPNVDLVVADPYNWDEINPETADLVISGQCLEHVEYPWLTMEQIARVMKPGALHFNIVPSTGPVHRFPIDTYRYHVDGMVALAKWAKLDVVECIARADGIWNNTVLVARKPE